MDPYQLLARHHGVLTARQLRGCTPTVQELLRAGVLTRIRRGWYRSPQWADPKVLRAVTAGGALTCLPALNLLGLWTPPCGAVHCRRPQAISGLFPDGVQDCRPWGRRPPVLQSVDGLELALRCAGRCRPSEEFVVVLDSALNKDLITREGLERLLCTESSSVRKALAKVDLAESGTETLTRLRLRARNIKVRPQVSIPGIGRVDLLIGERLIIEVDSREHHSKGDGYESDRRRDQALISRGYRVIRISYWQVLHQWEQPEAAILATIRRGDHYWRGGRRRS